MKIKNIIAASVLTFVLVFSSALGCRPRTPQTGVDGGGGGSTTAAETSVGTSVGTSVSSTSSGPVDAGRCNEKCPEVLPNAGEACDVVADQYCEYAGSVCKFANCNTGTGVWQVGDLNPCACYPGTATTVSRE